MIRLKDYTQFKVREKELVHINNTILVCIIELMKVDNYPKIKELQLILKSVKNTYEKELKNERLKNGKLERFGKKNPPKN